ncbi:hypothetical protein HDU96_005764 [Phlyctochytrium bullatum]|nr:hypothetical protein HDU96_005764 [Phlyctochytrium bullatum]
MTILVLGQNRTGKTELIKSFLSNSGSHNRPIIASKQSNSNLLTVIASVTSSALKYVEPESQPSSRGTPGPPPTKAEPTDIFLNPYSPTIEDGYTFQFMLPPDPAYNAPYASLPPPPPSAHVPREPLFVVSGETPQVDTKPLSESELEEKARQNRQRVVLHIIDAGGAPFVAPLWPSMIEAADAYMLVYDVGSRASYDEVWSFFKMITEVRCQLPGDIPMLLVGSMESPKGSHFRNGYQTCFHSEHTISRDNSAGTSICGTLLSYFDPGDAVTDAETTCTRIGSGFWIEGSLLTRIFRVVHHRWTTQMGISQPP